jgi:DNA-binding MarR family transcriptional regulator
VGERATKRGRHRITVDLLRELSASLDALTNAASPNSGLNRTDMRALDIINMQPGLTAGNLAARLKLTTGAITGVLDRLERSGLARRTHDQGDRRRVVVQPTAEAKRQGSMVFRQLGPDMERLLAGRTSAEVDMLEDFLRAVIEMVSERAESLSATERPERGKRAVPGA